MTQVTGPMRLDFEAGGKEVMDELGGDGLPAVPAELAVDPGLQPEKFNAVTAAILSDKPEDFTIEGPPDGSVTLIAGYVDPSGNRFTNAEVRELRGRDEEMLARAWATGDMVRYIDAILKVGVVRVGEVTDEKELAKALDTLLLGDRDLLVMQVRRLAYGDTMRLEVKCPFCEADFTVDYSFSDDVPLKPFTVEGSGDRSQRVFDIELPSGSVAEIRLVDGKAQKVVYAPENLKKTGEELNTLLLKELVVSIDNVPTRGAAPFLDMPTRDRRHLLNWLGENQPGPQYDDVKQECPDCTREFPLVMTLGVMFRG